MWPLRNLQKVSCVKWASHFLLCVFYVTVVLGRWYGLTARGGWVTATAPNLFEFSTASVPPLIDSWKWLYIVSCTLDYKHLMPWCGILYSKDDQFNDQPNWYHTWNSKICSWQWYWLRPNDWRMILTWVKSQRVGGIRSFLGRAWIIDGAWIICSMSSDSDSIFCQMLIRQILEITW